MKFFATTCERQTIIRIRNHELRWHIESCDFTMSLCVTFSL